MLVAVVSVKGSPGVTTFCLVLAARWPSPVRAVVVEADPSGGDIAARFSLSPTPGLVSLAAATRRNPDPAVLWEHMQSLPGGLPVIVASPDADQACAALAALDSAGTNIVRAAANAPDIVVVADCGRADPSSAAMPIVCSADMLVLLTRARSDDLAHLATRLPVVGRWAPFAGLLLVGNGHPISEVGRELGVRPWGRVPWDDRGAAVLCGRPSRGMWRRSGPSHSALGRFAHMFASAIAPCPAMPPGVVGDPAERIGQVLRLAPRNALPVGIGEGGEAS